MNTARIVQARQRRKHRQEVTRRGQQSRPSASIRLSAGLPSPAHRAAIADAVHTAVVAQAGDQGIGACHLYARVGAVVTNVLLGEPAYVVQIGSLRLRPDPQDPVAGIAHDARDGGLQRREFHAWIARGHDGGRVEFVDLAARHYPAFATLMGQPWGWEERPSFLWCWAEDFPSWVRLIVEPSETEAEIRHLASRDDFAKLLANTAKQALDLLGYSPRRPVARS